MWNLLIIGTLVVANAATPFESPNRGFSLGIGESAGGLFSATQFEHHHGLQYSIVSGGGQTIQQGILLNSFDFKLHQNLDLRIHLDLAQNAPINALNGAGETGEVLPGIELDYRPTKNLYFHLDWGRNPYTAGFSGFGGDPLSPWLEPRPWGFSRR